MNRPHPPRLETPRLSLRGYDAEDFSHFAAYFASERSRFTDGPVNRIQAWDLFCAGLGRWGLVGYGAWSIERREDHACMGLVSLNSPGALPDPELGWILYEGYESQGYALEAAKAALNFAFETLNWPRLLSGIHEQNSRSIKLAERLGAKQDLTLKIEDEAETLIFRHFP